MAVCSQPPSPPDSVDIGLEGRGEVVVDHIGQRVDVEASSCNVSCDHDLRKELMGMIRLRFKSSIIIILIKDVHIQNVCRPVAKTKPSYLTLATPEVSERLLPFWLGSLAMKHHSAVAFLGKCVVNKTDSLQGRT